MTERQGKSEPVHAIRQGEKAPAPTRIPSFPPSEPKKPEKRVRKGLRRAVGAVATTAVLGGSFLGYSVLTGEPRSQESVGPTGPQPIGVEPGPTGASGVTNPPENQTPENPYAEFRPTGEVQNILKKRLDLGIVPLIAGRETRFNGDNESAFLSGVVMDIDYKKLKGYGYDGDVFTTMKVYFGKHNGEHIIGNFAWNNDWLVGIYNLKGKTFYSTSQYPLGSGIETPVYATEAQKFGAQIEEGLRKGVYHQFVFEVVTQYDSSFEDTEEIKKLYDYTGNLFKILRGEPSEPLSGYGWIRSAVVPPTAQ